MGRSLRNFGEWSLISASRNEHSQRRAHTMTTISPRTQSILDLVSPNHPLASSMRGVIIAASAANEGFAGRKIALEADPGRTPVGRRDELRKDLTEKRGKALQRAE